mgnify:CR=1 FL=1
MIELEAALQQILANVAPITDQLEVPLAKARRQVLARDLQAGISQPPFDNSAMDGYAVKAPVTAGTPLAVTQRVAAGQCH